MNERHGFLDLECQIDRLVDGVLGVGSNVDLAASAVHRYRSGYGSVAQLGERGSLPVLVLTDILGQLDSWEAYCQGSEESAGS